MSPNSLAAQGRDLPPVRGDVEVMTGGAVVPTRARAVLNQRYEPPNVSSGALVATVQSMIRAAENGNPRELFAFYRDHIVSGSHVQSEFGKRKMPVLSEPHSLQPPDPKSKADVDAAVRIGWMIDNCDNWLDGLTAILDSSLWPVSVNEKLFAPAPPNDLGIRFRFKRFEPVNYTLLCMQYWSDGSGGSTGRNGSTGSGGSQNGAAAASPYQEVWEKDLRVWNTDADGNIIWDAAQAYHLDPMRHIVHRGHLLVGMPDRFGGPMRSVLFWQMLAFLLRDWLGRGMERYGSPFPVVKTDMSDADKVNALREALSLSTKIGGLVVDESTEVELESAATTDMATAYEKCLNICNREISKVILGQTLSGTVDPTGLGSGTSNLAGEVRDDFKRFDRRKLAFTLRHQLFKYFLEINGIPGAAPNIVWGGLSAADAKAQSGVLVDLNNAGLEPTDEAIPTVSERVGFEVQRKAVVAPGPGLGIAAFSAGGLSLPVMTHPSDRFAAEGAGELAAAFRMEFQEVRALAASSRSASEFLMKLQHALPHLNPEKILKVAEPILQKCAAAGAAAAVKK